MKKLMLLMLSLGLVNVAYGQDGTQYNEDNALTTVNTTTTTNTNTNNNTNVNTNNNTNTNTNNNTNVNTNTNVSTNTNTNFSTATNNNNNTNTSSSVSTSTNNNNNVNTSTSTSTSTVNSTVNQNVNNTTTSNNTNVNTSTNTNINKSESESNVNTNNVNQNNNNTVSNNTNRNINESSSVQTINQNVKSKAPPASAIAPSIMSYSQDICRVGASAAFSGQVIGLSGGKTIVDENCERLKLSKYLYDMGMKVASVSLLCQDERVFKAMSMAGTPCPYKGKIGKEATIAWQENPSARPDEADAKKEFIAQCTQESNPKRDRIKRDVVGLFSKVVISKTKTKGQCIDEFYGK